MWRPSHAPLLFLCALAVVGGSGRAAAVGPDLDDPAGLTARKTETGRPVERRRPGLFFHRPAKDTPAAQLAYADDLLARGRQRSALSALNALVHRWHAAPEAVRAQLTYARILESMGKLPQAFDEFQYAMQFYVGQFAFDDVLARQQRIAEQIVNMRHGRLLGLPGWRDPAFAVPFFETLLQNAPRSRLAPDWQYRIGQLREEDGDLERAVRVYELTASRYPNSPRAEEAAVRRAMCLYRLAADRPRSERALTEAVGAFEGLVDAYPRSKAVADARPKLEELTDRLAVLVFERAEFYDRLAHPRQPQAASLAYLDFLRRFPSSNLASAASTRLETLRKELGPHENSAANTTHR
jgi:outer membrane protein assembly factor BamD (BamD/ComL family)